MPPANKTLAAPLSAPRFAAAWAALVYLLAAMTLGYPALAGGFLVNPRSDQYIAGFAFRDFAAQSLRAGHGFPTWNPFMYGGMPYVAAMHGDIFYPTFLLRMVLPTDAAMTWGFIIHTVLAGLFTYCFLRAWGLGFYPALFGGLAYMLGGPVASYVSPGHDGKLFVSSLLPLGLWMLVRAVRDGRAYAWGVFALTVGLAVLSPHPQLLQYFLLTCGAFALFCAFAARADGTPADRRVALRRLAFALGAVLIGASIGAVQYVPVREYVAWSPRAGGTPYEFATSFSFPLEELVNLYLPQFSGILDKYWGRNGLHFHSEYLGVVVLVLAGAGLASARRGFRWFWIGTGVVALLWMLGGSTPFYRLVYAVVPGTKFFRAPSTFIYIFAFAVAVLAALGLERVLARELRPRYLVGWGVAVLLVTLLATSGALTNLAASVARTAGDAAARAQGMDPAQVADQIDQAFVARARSNGPAIVFGGLRSFLFAALALGLLFAHMRGKLKPRALAVALLAVALADLWSVAREYWQFSPPASRLYASDPVIEYLKTRGEPGRVLVRGQGGEGLAHPDPYFGSRAQGIGTGLMVHGIPSVTGYHGNELGRYQELEQYQGAGTEAPLTPMFWRHENVRYLYTNAPLADSGFKLLVGPVRNSAGSTVYLYRVPGDNPPAWVAPTSAKVPDASMLSLLMDPRFDPRRVAVVSDTSPLQVPALAALPEPLGLTTTVTRPAPDRVSVELSAPAPAGSMLVVSENYFPGWRASAGGSALPAVRANFNLIGVPLSAGVRRVDLDFHDPGYETGRTITWIGLFLALGLIGAGAYRDRRAGRA